MDTKKIIEEKCRQIVTQQMGITHPISNIHVEAPNLQGEHMCSSCYYCTVEFTNEWKPVSFFIKAKLLIDGPMQHMVNAIKAFETEGKFLTEFLPEMKKFCQRAEVIDKMGLQQRLDSILPKAFYASDEMIIMENKTSQGFVCRDKAQLHDETIASLVVKNLGFFHGISYSMIQSEGKIQFLRKRPYLHNNIFNAEANASGMEKFYNNSSNAVIKILQASLATVPGSKETLKKLKTWGFKDSFAVAKKVFLQEKFLFNAVGHGDCWMNNLMFKVDPVTQTPISLAFVDFQMSSVGSPSLDLSYYLYSSVDPQVRRKNILLLLKTYFDEFRSTVKTLGFPLDYNFMDFLNDFQRNSKFGFVTGFMFIVGLLAINDIDVDKSGDAIKDFGDVIEKNIISNPQLVNDVSTKVVQFVEEFLDFPGYLV